MSAAVAAPRADGRPGTGALAAGLRAVEISAAREPGDASRARR
jgi:hypothetical protein